MNVKGMPKSCLGGEYGEKLRQKMSDLMQNYYSGELSQEELQQKIRNKADVSFDGYNDRSKDFFQT